MRARRFAPARRSLRLHPLEDRTAPALVTWDGGGGDSNWHNALNWDTDTVPVATDDVRINTAADTATIATGSDVTVAGFNLSAGTVGGGGDLIVTGTFVWTGGTLAGTGTTTATGPMIVAGGTHRLDGRTLINAGTAVWSAGDIVTRNGAAFVVAGGLTASSDADFLHDGTGARATFHITSTGNLTKTAGAAYEYPGHGPDGTWVGLGVDFNNDGAAVVLAGNLALLDGGTSTGSFHGAAGTELFFSGVQHLNGPITAYGVAFHSWPEGGSTTVAGTYQATGYTLVNYPTTFTATVVNVGHLLVDDLADFGGNAITTATVEMRTGTAELRGTGALTVTGLLDWSGGTLAVETKVTGATTMSGGTHVLSGRPLHLHGPTSWAGGTLLLRHGAAVHNHGTLTARGDDAMDHDAGAAGAFHNYGTFVKAAGSAWTPVPGDPNGRYPGWTRIGTQGFDDPLGLPFHNHGSVAVQHGLLVLTAGGAGAGSFTGDPGAGLYFSGDHDLGGAVVADRVWFDGFPSGGEISVLGPYESRLFTAVVNMPVTFAGPAASVGPALRISGGGLADFQDKPVTVPELRLLQGTLRTDGLVTVTAQLLGAGVIDATVVSSGELSPGTSPGTIDVRDAFTQSGSGGFQVEIGGLTAGSQFDRLLVGGQVTLDGQLNLSLTGGFTPSAGDTFTVLDGPGSLSGMFSGLPEGRVIPVGDNRFEIRYVGGDVQLIGLNEAPVLGPITGPGAPVSLGNSVTLSATFTDANRRDDHTATWDWGDGTTSTELVPASNGTGTTSSSRAYTAAGVYTVTLTICDGHDGTDTESYQYVVVYSPGPGSVSGNHQFVSPAEAFPAVPGTAKFGFSNVRHPVGQPAPTGQFHFHFQPADIKFKETGFDWLVIDDHRAFFQGTGTVNNNSGYGFRVSVIDGQVSGGGTDLIRVKIWDAATLAVVYDSQPGAADAADPTTEVAGNLKIQGGSPLLARGAPAEGRQLVAPDAETVNALARAAVDRWVATGLSAGQEAVLRSARLFVGDLTGPYLGAALPDDSLVVIDDDGGGWGWFADPTPADDAEFTARGDQGERGRIDLLTVLMHEFGHLLGHDHGPAGLMADALAPGVRWDPDHDHEVPAATADPAPTVRQPRELLSGWDATGDEPRRAAGRDADSVREPRRVPIPVGRPAPVRRAVQPPPAGVVPEQIELESGLEPETDAVEGDA